MPRLTEYRDRVAIVTGASSGIGAQLARDLAARGMRVALLARRAERLEVLAAEIARAGGAAAAVPCDVSERASVQAAVEAVCERHGGVDLLVNDAGYGRHVLFKDHDVEDIERMMRTNYLGTVWAIKAALPSMRRRGRGWIVNVSSVAGKIGQPDEAAYSASKFAVAGLSEALAYELGPLGIHVMAVYPALVRTEMFTPDVLARMPERVQRTFIEPAEFTRHVLRALERGAYEVTVPPYVGIAYLVRLLLPSFFRRQTARLRLPSLPDLAT
jgi:short-subunit dehydrogenase